MLSLFDFGKKRRRSVKKVSRKGSRKVRKGSRKPPARLLKICKKYHIKTTRKVGGKRVYKPSKVLAKMCLKKAMLKAKKKKMSRRSGFGNKKSTMMMPKQMMGSEMMPPTAFGKRRGGRKVSKAAAMKAFKSFYKRHCSGMRRSRFGNGGNPPLMNSMGYEFCPSGMGGVLGANSTGLFPSPCTSMNIGQSQAEAAATLPAYSSTGIGAAATSSQLASYANMFGRRRQVRRRSTAVGAKRKTAVGAVRRRRRSTAVGAKRKTALGRRHKKVRRSTAVGTRKRVSEIGRRHKKVRRSTRKCYT